MRKNENTAEYAEMTDDAENFDVEQFSNFSDLDEIGADTNHADLADFSSEQLCNVIISFRYLGIIKDRAIAAMRYLVDRKNAGDVFDFEKYISEEISKLPDISFKQQFFSK